MVEVRDITEATIKRDVYDPRLLRRQADCGFAKTGPDDVSVGRHTSHSHKSAQKVVGAQARLFRKRRQRKWGIRILLDYA
jgi:hypothetical protein